MLSPSHQHVGKDNTLKNMGAFLKELQIRSGILWNAGLLLLTTVPVFACLSIVDDRTITGVNAWYKPMKFAISTAIFLLTMAWMLGDLTIHTRLKKVYASIFSGVMLLEVALVTLQVLRGTTSHFNTSTPLNTTILLTMGTAIYISTFIVILVFWHYWKHYNQSLSKAYLVTMRWSIIIFLLGSFVGTAMISMKAHTVGAADGGEGLPFLNWSITSGDLRTAHFIGLHAIQILPLAYWLAQKTKLPKVAIAVHLFGMGYLLFTIFVLSLAVNGIPLIR